MSNKLNSNNDVNIFGLKHIKIKWNFRKKFKKKKSLNKLIKGNGKEIHITIIPFLFLDLRLCYDEKWIGL